MKIDADIAWTVPYAIVAISFVLVLTIYKLGMAGKRAQIDSGEDVVRADNSN